MAPQFASETSLYVALFLCGAIGYLVTRWAKTRLFNARLQPKAA
eukprot:CAMPEP_0176288206 /NCGR_PEP_ID=MMETSP0121_2-20121125/53847_1 /TAXON_ID=160619 /ORGANISM="Kryptoperidinium foliaceum, Strain CCMP 1326" /LENGTH=43 /DNA_ID= /DNA_START= /DNA_END= /DNA_ORIENTATION=